MSGHRYTARDRTVRKRIRGALVEENLRTGARKRIGKREVDYALDRMKRDGAPELNIEEPAHAAGKADALGRTVRTESPKPVQTGPPRRKDKKRYRDESRHLERERLRRALDDLPEEEVALSDEAEAPAEAQPIPERKPKQRIKSAVSEPSALAKDEKKIQLRKQAQTFRNIRQEEEATQETVEDVVEKEMERTEVVRRHRLHHEEGSGMAHGADALKHIAAVPAKRVLRHEEEDFDENNPAVQGMVTGSNLMHESNRHVNLRTGSSRLAKAEEARVEHAAETEKRKKDEIHAFQKKKRQRAAAAGKRSQTASTAGGVADNLSGMVSVPERAKKAVQSFFSEHKGTILALGAFGMLMLLFCFTISSCTSSIQGSGTFIIETTYFSSDEDIYAAENAYRALEDALDAQINTMQLTHPGYDDYEYQIDEIEHNPYHLISYLQVKYGGFVYDDTIKAAINNLFKQQYILSVSEKSETRTKMETVLMPVEIVDPETGEVTVEEMEVEQEVEYEHKTLYVVLTNRSLEMIVRNSLTEDEAIVYDALNRTFGNRPNLFDLTKISGGGSAGINYTIPPEALSDEKFRNIILEAQKYIGMPYVWGGKTPRSGFDCSGFVCWVLNHCANNWDVGQKRAKELCRMCIYVSPSEARPGDLVFFEKTYDTDGASHVGIYVGDGVMLHCGNPIKYSSIHSDYFTKHFLCFGRLPFYDK